LAVRNTGHELSQGETRHHRDVRRGGLERP